MSDHTNVAVTEDGTGRKSLKTYITGFILSIILTLVSFGVVAKQLLTPDQRYWVLVIVAILLLIIQVVFFLRLNAKPKGRMNLMAFLFTILVVAIIVAGSLWIMYNLNYNMVN